MAAAIPKQADCCSPCDNSSSGGSQVPGPPGPAGANGTNGTDGVNSFTTLTAQFTIPIVGNSDIATVDNSDWAVIGQVVALQGGGNGFEVVAKPSSTQITLENLGYPSNQVAGTIVPIASQLGPGGEQGDAGVAPSVTLNSISPTTARGDIMADNGANAPAASVTRLAAGSDGEQLTADSGQPTGLRYSSIHPTVATDNAIVRFNGAAGTPVPGQTSLLVITDDGSIQSSPTGGNARGSMATDLQVSRGVATQVASGANSVIAGGQNNSATAANSAVIAGDTNVASGSSSFVGGGATNAASAAQASVGAGSNNTASGARSFVGGGILNTASNTDAGVACGNTNTASGSKAFVGGGDGNTASGISAAILAGQNNTASEDYSAVPGGRNGNAELHGSLSHAAGAFAASGDAQATFLHWFISTTDATANVEMFLDGLAKVAAIASGKSWGFHILLVGRSDAGVDALWETKGLIKNIAGATSLTGAVTQSILADGTGATWGVSGNVVVDANNGNDSLRIRVTGAAATNIRWHAHARIVEVGWL